MKNIKQILGVIALMALIPLSVSAQDYTFMILGTKGNVQVNGKTPKVGENLLANHTVTVPPNAYLGLAHASGSTLEITQPGTYKVKDLEAKISKEDALTGKFASFVIDEITGKSDDGNGSRQVKYGSVTRNTKPVKINMPSKTAVLRGEVALDWELKGKQDHVQTGPFKLVVKDISQNILMETPVEGNSTVLDLNDEKLKGHDRLVYFVEAIDNKRLESGQYLFEVKEAEVPQADKEQYEALKSKDSALGKMMLAKFYEDKGLLPNAKMAYHEAIKLSFGSEQYQKVYERFAARYGL
ncbi:hypothetical protein V6R21_26040 [Limibacter armeniacum]|uniref:hypothetical protein n=1 Tax=Limibacter armeniacum TaxID=466084 RepID=UPI002FE5DDE0